MSIAARYRMQHAAMSVGLLLAFVSARSLAADPSSAPLVFIPHPMTMLLRSPIVHRELGLSADQKAVVEEAVEAWQ